MQGPRTFCSASAEAIANVEDILTEILVLVPARSLIRFKCVSKHWYSLISHPKFRHRHTLQNPSPNISAFFYGYEIEKQSFGSFRLGTHGKLSGNPFIGLSGLGLEVLQSCNGLFLCVPNLKISVFEFGAEPSHDPIYVINPTTNEFLALSSPKGRVAFCIRYALAFDPSKSSHYKVVCLCQYHIEIYSSETRTWRLLEISFPSSNYMQNLSSGILGTMESGVYCNGAIHWMTDQSRSRNSSEGGKRVTGDHVLYYYDLSEERMGVAGHISTCEIDDLFPRILFRYFGESGGHLYLIDIYRDSEFDVMEMERDYSGWFVSYHVDLNLVSIRALGLHNSSLYVLYLGKEDQHEERAFSVLFIPRNHEIIWSLILSRTSNYKHGKRRRRKRNRTVKEISTQGCLVLESGHYYMETLAPVL
ncbi:F-box protein At5g07610-like [Argentina anserina]|uniref:F-box protein At5g07610-like n=1 Tax=Argentina anserina TaxID=57926 RepID=UPI0021766DAD|nr:F-box protein At5g07610-like [Potentilla anserina]